MTSTICFTSDFGLGDTWVGVCHAVILRACPAARVVDLDHQVPPFDLRKAAVVAAAGVRQVPDAIHLVIVDPGVGGGRRDLCVVTGGGVRLVGPDNGVLLPAAGCAGGVATAFALDPLKLRPEPPLPTFHARDVLAPSAAALACGVDPAALGAEVDPGSLTGPPFGGPVVEGGAVLAEVVDADRFGSIRIGVGEEDIARLGLDGPRLSIGLGHLTLEVPFGRTFSDVPPGEPVALVDSSGWLTLAVNLGSAAERYGIEPGAQARLRPVG